MIKCEGADEVTLPECLNKYEALKAWQDIRAYEESLKNEDDSFDSLRYKYSKDFEEDYIDKAEWLAPELREDLKWLVDSENEVIDEVERGAERNKKKLALWMLLSLMSSQIVCWNFAGIMLLAATATWVRFRKHV